jgi:hypothetical protein
MSKAITTKKFFNRETTITETIQAKASAVWQILVDINNYPNWNSTIVSITGDLKEGGKIGLISKLDPSRKFNLKVLEFEPTKKLIWGDMMGKRTYLLSENSDGQTQFTMTEKIGGLVFPLFAKMIPPFDDSFEQFTKDLKVEAESL